MLIVSVSLIVANIIIIVTIVVTIIVVIVMYSFDDHITFIYSYDLGRIIFINMMNIGFIIIEIDTLIMLLYSCFYI